MAGHVLSPPTPSWHRRPQYALQQLRACRCRAMIAAHLFATVRNLFFPSSDYLYSPQCPVFRTHIHPPTLLSGCHWCHEFQANHEIRVCDRCDAFYCRGCDEMDQCEDCSEVVCNTCSTLMSCKFCGCGLCEDCATACGR